MEYIVQNGSEITKVAIGAPKRVTVETAKTGQLIEVYTDPDVILDIEGDLFRYTDRVYVAVEALQLTGLRGRWLETKAKGKMVHMVLDMSIKVRA